MIYVGSSNHIDRRWKKHRYELNHNKHPNSYLQRAWNKYGEGYFIFVILEITTELISREQHYIDYFQSFIENKGYNLRRKAENNTGMKFSEDHKRKLSISNKGKKVSDETRLKLSKVIQSKESRLKRSILMTGRVASNEAKLNMSRSRKGKPHSKEHIEKVANANRGRKQSLVEIERKRLSLRQFDKWPCADGWKCKCEKCIIIQREYNKLYMRKRRNEVKLALSNIILITS